MIVAMDTATVWRWTHAERAALEATLTSLPPQAWEHPSLCDG